jgi:uncharacterized protein YegL
MKSWRTSGNGALDAAAMTFDDGENHAQRLPLALALDTSSSMSGTPIARLNEALGALAEELQSDPLLAATVELAIVTFGDGGVTAWRGDQRVPPGTSPFISAAGFRPPRLHAGGVTPLTTGVERTMQCIAEEKADLRRRFLQYYRPHIWLFSDGQPTNDSGEPSDDWRHLPAAIRTAEANGRFLFFTVSAGGIDPVGDAVLRELAPDAHVRLEGVDFTSALKQVSASTEFAAGGQSAEAIKRRVTSRWFGGIQDSVPRI